jgi:hypothetical protein
MKDQLFEILGILVLWFELYRFYGVIGSGASSRKGKMHPSTQTTFEQPRSELDCPAERVKDIGKQKIHECLVLKPCSFGRPFGGTYLAKGQGVNLNTLLA